MNMSLGLSLYAISGASVFDPATLSLTGWWRGSYSASPWTGTASAGSSGSRNLTEATNAPASGTAVNGFNPADFDGTNDRLKNASAISNFYSASAYAGWALINIDAISTDDGTNVYENDCVLTTQPQAYWLLYLRSSGSASISHHDGNFKIVSVSFSTGAWKLLQWNFDGSTVKLRINGGSWQTVAAGSISDLTNTIAVGTNYGDGQFVDGKVLDLGLINASQSDATHDNIRSYIIARYGVSV